MRTNFSSRLGRLALSIVTFFAFIAINTGAAVALPLLVAPANDEYTGATLGSAYDLTNTITSTYGTVANISNIDVYTPQPGQTYTDPDAPNCTNGTGAFKILYTAWYTYTSPAAYGDLEIDTLGSDSNSDTVLAVWTLGGSGLVPVACNDDLNSNNILSRVNVLVQPSTQYYIEVGLSGRADNVVYAATGNMVNLKAKFTSMPNQVNSCSFIQYTTFDSLNYYDDRCSSILYSANWVTTSLSIPLNHAFHESNHMGDAAFFYFTGQRFTILTGTTKYGGNLDVYVDNLFYGQIPLTSNTTTWQETTWISPVLLSNSIHGVMLVNHSDDEVYLDGVRINTATVLTPPTTITDLAVTPGTDPGTAVLTWTAPQDYDANTSVDGYQVRYSIYPISNEAYWTFAAPVGLGIPTPNTPGLQDTMTISGLAPGVTYYFSVRSFDANTETTSSPNPVTTISEPNLSAISNSPSTEPPVPPPEGVGTYDDNDPSWIYTGNWSARTGLTGPYKTTLHFSSDINAVASFVMSGNQFAFKYTKAPSRGTIQVWVDNAPLTYINANSSTLVWQATYTSPVLDAGTHIVTFLYGGPNGKYIDVDAIQVKSVPVPFDDADLTDWAYSGSWTARTGISGPYARTLHVTSDLSATASITITGYQFSFKYTRASNRGHIIVTVDGGQIKDIDAYNSTTIWQATYTSPPLSGGPTHTVVISNGGPSENPSGHVIDVDVLQVIPPIFDDANTVNPWNYTGSWTARSGLTGPYAGTLHSTGDGSATASITVSGSQFVLKFTKYVNRSKDIEILMDGNPTPIDNFSEYGTTTVWQATYTSPIFPTGTHIFTFQNMGASGTVMDIDAMQVFP